MIRTIKIYLCKLLIKKVESTRILSPLPPESLTEKKKKKNPGEWEMATLFGRGVMRRSY